MENKKSFILYKDWLNPIKSLSKDDAGKLFLAILNFANGELPELQDSYADLYYAIEEQIVYEWSKLNPKSKKYHWNYKGGISTENKIIRNSTSSKIWREKVFERDKYTCNHCSERGGTLNAHHIKPFATFPELRFELSNGLTLCNKCHIIEHKRMRNI